MQENHVWRILYKYLRLIYNIQNYIFINLSHFSVGKLCITCASFISSLYSSLKLIKETERFFSIIALFLIWRDGLLGFDSFELFIRILDGFLLRFARFLRDGLDRRFELLDRILAII